MPANRRAPRINMTDVVYNIIQKRPKKGFAPCEILEQPEADGITARSFPYLQLYKLKKGGEIIEKEGRYYPIEEVTSAGQWFAFRSVEADTEIPFQTGVDNWLPLESQSSDQPPNLREQEANVTINVSVPPGYRLKLKTRKDGTVEIVVEPIGPSGDLQR